MDEISLTAEREQVVDFSDPYYVIQQGLLVKEGRRSRARTTHRRSQAVPLRRRDGHHRPGLHQEHHQAGGSRPSTTTRSTAAQALSNGQIDAVVIDVPIAIP